VKFAKRVLFHRARLAETGISREAEQWHQKVQSTKYENYSFVRMNLEDREQLNQLFETEKFDKVCNLAAQAGVRYSLENPHAYINSNIVGFINILEACRHHHIKHLAYASSSSVYGNNTKMPLSTSDNVDHPISLYAATKKSNELMAHTYSHLFGLSREISEAFHWELPTTGLRFFTVYGPCLSREMRSKFQREGRPDMALFLFTKAILENQPIKVFNNGNMPVPWNAKHIPLGVRDFTYIDDMVEGVVRVIDNAPIGAQNNIAARISPPQRGGVASPTGEDGVVKAPDKNSNPEGSVESGTGASQSSPLGELEGASPYKVYNIGNSSPVQLMEYIAAIETTLGKTAKKEFLPLQPGDVPRTEADVTDLVENLGYKPNTPVQKGIELFIKWYRQYFYQL
jgi:UDP-glucuronate 4-epimerase